MTNAFINRRRRSEASGQKSPSPTFDPVTKGQPGVGGAESVSQHPLLVADDCLQHGLVLDLSGGDNDAAVHEVCDGVGHILFALGQEGLQTEHLSEHQRRQLNTPGSLVWRDFTVWSFSLSPSRPSEHPSHGRFRCSSCRSGRGPPEQRRSGRGRESPGQIPSPRNQSA